MGDGLSGMGNSPEAVIASVSAHSEIAQTVAAMPQAQLQLCLGTMQRLAVEAPENARAFLQDNPQLCYALLHAQLLLGLTLEPSLPPTEEEIQRLRAEAAQRPTLLGLVQAGAGIVVPPGMPGFPGGPPRPMIVVPPMGFPGMHGGMGGPRLIPGRAVFPPLNPGLMPGGHPGMRSFGLCAPPPPPAAALGAGLALATGLAPKAPMPPGGPGMAPLPA